MEKRKIEMTTEQDVTPPHLTLFIEGILKESETNKISIKKAYKNLLKDLKTKSAEEMIPQTKKAYEWLKKHRS